MVLALSSVASTLFSKAALAIFVKHIIGGVNYALVNVIYDSEAYWVKNPTDQSPPTFKRPAFQSSISFFSGFITLLPFLIAQIIQTRRGKQSDRQAYSWKAVSLLVLPSVFDYVAVTMSLTSNKWIVASMIVVIKGCRVLFSTVLSKTFLKYRYYGYHWVGIALVFPGVVLYSIGNIQGNKWLEDSASSRERKSVVFAAIGMVMAFLAESMRAAKAVYEEKMLKGLNMCPKFIAVVEGGLCTLLSVISIVGFHMIPGTETDTVGIRSENGSMENFFWTMDFIRHSKRVQILVVYMIFTIGIITYFGFLVTKYLSAVQNAIWGEMRILIVYLTELVIALCQGERFFTPWTALQVVGFGFLILSGVVFNKKVRLPWQFLYPQTADEIKLDYKQAEDDAKHQEPETI